MVDICLRKGAMMTRWSRNLVGVLAVLLVCATAQAELKLVANFDGFPGTPDGQACNGVLGATIDTESEGTGNVSFQTVNGSGTLSPIGHSSGTLSRAAGVAGINNPIANDETGVAFFRFSMATGGDPRPHGFDCRYGEQSRQRRGQWTQRRSRWASGWSRTARGSTS
jgi:hypothetical protein